MNALLKQLTAKSSELRLSRATRIVDSLETAQVALVGNIKAELNQIREKIEEHIDFGRNNTTSLKFEDVGDRTNWVEKLQKLETDKDVKKVELKIAEKTLKRLFKIEEEAIDITQD